MLRVLTINNSDIPIFTAKKPTKISRQAWNYEESVSFHGDLQVLHTLWQFLGSNRSNYGSITAVLQTKSPRTFDK